jgi:hypothetical protein
MGTVTGEGDYAYSSNATVSASANTGYSFVQWNDGNTANPRTVTVTSDMSFIAEFEAIIYHVTLYSNDQNMGTVIGEGNYAYNSNTTVSATANTGYRFARWNDGNTDNPRTVTVTSDMNFTAEFEAIIYHVTVSANNQSMGTVTGEGDYTYNSNTTVSASANTGYRFVRWNDGYTDNPRTVTVTSDMNFTAEFEAIIYHVTVSSNNHSMGTVTGEGDYTYNSNATVSASANTGYRFVRWNDGNTDNPRTVTVTSDMSFTAEFEIMIYHVTVSSNNQNMGSVTGGGDYVYYSIATVSATANTGYRFVRWNDGNTNNPRTVTVTSNMSFTAEFEIITYHVTVSSNNQSMGTVTGEGNYAYNSNATVSATANTGYRFVRWNEGNTNNPRTVTVTSNVWFTAEFEIITYYVTVSSNNQSMGIVTGEGDYAYNSNATVSASANTGYRFVQWNDGNTDNPRTVTVTSDISFTATFVKVKSDDATLSNLTVSAGSLSFDANTTSYTVNVTNNVTSISVTGTANHNSATVSGNVSAKSLNVGSNEIKITVTAEDEVTTKTYTVTIVRAASSDATLSNLTLSSGTLSFDANTTSYTVNVANNVTSISVTGTATHNSATVSGNVTGKTLDVGDNVVNITVTAEDGTTTKTYTVTIHRLSNDATLSSLTLSSGDLSPAFNTNTTSYTVNVTNAVTVIDITGAANHSAATVGGNVTGKTLEVGDNTVNITVTAEDGTTKTYTVIVHRISNDATLSSLTLSVGELLPAFNANTTNYTVNVDNSVTSINVTGVANHSAATVSGNVSGMTLNVGDNTVNITVTAEDGTTCTYTVNIIRSDHIFVTEANLIEVNQITVTGNTVEYTVPCGEMSLTFNLQASPYSTVTVDGVPYFTGRTGEKSIDFNVSSDITSTIKVKAEVGEAENSYTLNITAPFNDSRLYYSRWDDVLAINLNPNTNGGHNITEIRWYGQNGTPISNEGYIPIQPGTAQSYYAEIRVNNKLRRACNNPETKSTDAIVAYPNPVPRGESLQLQLPDAFVGSVLNIYEVRGALVKSGLPLPAKNNSVNVSDLNSGIYLLSITGKEGNRQVIKIIIE